MFKVHDSPDAIACDEGSHVFYSHDSPCVVFTGILPIAADAATPIAYLPPPKVLDGLSADVAERRPSGLAHSIAEIVAHLAFWQDWFTIV